MIFTRRTRRLGAVALGATIASGAAAATLAANPVGAAGIISAVTTVSCSVTGANWCISGKNSSSGIGVIGTSKSGTGLRGTSTSQYGLKATSVSGSAILAQTTSGFSAITATGSSSQYGVNATGGTALYGTSSNSGDGVYGTTKSGNGVGIAGVVSGGGTGAYGVSQSGDGIYASSSTGTAGDFFSPSGLGVSAVSYGTGDALYARSINGTGADIQGSGAGIVGRASSLGEPLVLTKPNGDVVFEVDGVGDVSYWGDLYHHSAMAGGGATRSFSPSSTQPTVEDSGTAQLVRGAAVVRLDPAFAASIEPTAPYRVFVTPGGETNVLFVASKSAAGFVVRESHAGRSTVTFDYRIVATALGAAGRRMTILSPAAAREQWPRAPQRVLQKIPARLPASAVESATP